MAQIKIGRILPIFKGDYNATTSYAKLDIVYYEGNSYVAKDNNEGITPTNTTKWQIVAAKGSWASFTDEEKQELIEDIQHSLDSISITEGTDTYNDF